MPRAGTIGNDLEPEDFGEWLRSTRRANDITQAELAQSINYSQKLISNIEKGERKASQDFKDAVKAFLKSR